MTQNPVIFVPGITASELRDSYPVEPEKVWTAILEKQYRALTLHPDDLDYELKEPARIEPNAIFKLPYGDLIDELRHNLASNADEPVPVFPFAYDWRQPLERVEAQLAAFMKEVIKRTRLLRHYYDDGYENGRPGKVDLVGHSMGGMIITGCLQTLGKKARVGKVVTIGTPYRGSFEAVIKVITGTASLGGESSSSRERESARLTPALYHLIPDFEGALDTELELEYGLYQEDAWQSGVKETLASFIKKHGRKRINDPKKLNEEARDLLTGMLDVAWEHRQRIEHFRPQDANLTSARWMAIVGVDAKTRFRLRLDTLADGTGRFNLRSADRANHYSHDPSGGDDRTQTGDGTVPYLGAKPPFLSTNRLVCIRPRDFGYWEIADNLMLGTVGFHGMECRMNLTQRLTECFLKGTNADNIWGWTPPDLDGADWNPPIRGLRKKNK